MVQEEKKQNLNAYINKGTFKSFLPTVAEVGGIQIKNNHLKQCQKFFIERWDLGDLHKIFEHPLGSPWW